MAHLYSLYDFYIPYGKFQLYPCSSAQISRFTKFTFHNLSIYQFSRKNPSLAQFIPRIYNKIIIKILGYFWGVTKSGLVNEEVSHLHKGERDTRVERRRKRKFLGVFS